MCAAHGRDKTASALLKRGADTEAQTNCGSTPLHISAQFGTLKVALLLIRNGANVNAQNHRKRTPLHSAILADNEDVASRLAQARARIDLRDEVHPVTTRLLYTGMPFRMAKDLSITLRKATKF